MTRFKGLLIGLHFVAVTLILFGPANTNSYAAGERLAPGSGSSFTLKPLSPEPTPEPPPGISPKFKFNPPKTPFDENDDSNDNPGDNDNNLVGDIDSRPSLGDRARNEELKPPKTIELEPVKPNINRKWEKREILIVHRIQDAAQLANIVQEGGYEVIRRRFFRIFDFAVTTLLIPEDQEFEPSLNQLRSAFPGLPVLPNFLYSLTEGDAGDERTFGPRMIGWSNPGKPCTKDVSIGMVDTGINIKHPLLKNGKIKTKNFWPKGVPRAPKVHGTALATLLIAQKSESGPTGLLPEATLYSANVFRKTEDGGMAANLEKIITAIHWLIGQEVKVINMSIGGPPNELLARVVKIVLRKNVVMVAAAGNNGPDGDPVYPAAYDGVIAVTAVDADLRPFSKANQGDYISFAAPGVDIWIPTANGKEVYYSGTSFAVPFVTATAAGVRLAKPELQAIQIQEFLQSTSKDLGKPGKDPVYGHGLVQTTKTCLGKG